jgi:hypothetical protein
MKKPGKCCFLVKKKRPREAGAPRGGLLAPKENRKSKEIFRIKTENILEYPLKEVVNRNNKKNEGFKILGCEDHKIILSKLKHENKLNREEVLNLGIREKTKNKKNNLDGHLVTSMDVVLDYDKFLQELDRQDDKPEEVLPINDSNTSSTQIVIELEDKCETPPPGISELKPQSKVEKTRDIQKIEKSI